MTRRDTAGIIIRGPSLPCGCPLDSGCDSQHDAPISAPLILDGCTCGGIGNSGAHRRGCPWRML
jgi:hypothetical protein